MIGCLESGIESKEEGIIKSVINTNIESAENENIEEYMETIHPDSPAYEETRQTMEYLFDTYDLSYDLKDIDVIEITDQMVKVRIVQITKKVSGPEFEDNELTAVHTLKKYNDGWRFWSTDIEKIEYLD